MDRIRKNFGFGYMRLPMQGSDVDLEKTCEMVDAFLDAGFHYFDTAHGYLQGRSEKAIKPLPAGPVYPHRQADDGVFQEGSGHPAVF